MVVGFLETQLSEAVASQSRIGKSLARVSLFYHQQSGRGTERQTNPSPYFTEYYEHKLHNDQCEKLMIRRTHMRVLWKVILNTCRHILVCQSRKISEYKTRYSGIFYDCVLYPNLTIHFYPMDLFSCPVFTHVSRKIRLRIRLLLKLTINSRNGTNEYSFKCVLSKLVKYTNDAIGSKMTKGLLPCLFYRILESKDLGWKCMQGLTIP